MNSNSLLPWLQPDWEQLYSYIAQKRVPQALLITGNKGLGKQQLANQFALSLLCATPLPNGLHCGHCDSCKLINAETHPDFINIQPEEAGKSITIAQIRNLITQLTLKPQFESYRVVIVNPAEQMNHAAANAFLKCLEEPTERTIIILITDKPAKLPATIVSRCQKMAINIPARDITLSWLQQHGQKDKELLCDLARGAPLLAQQYAEEGHIILRNECFKTWWGIAKQQCNPVIVAEDWHKLPEAPLLFWVTSWIIDIIKCSYLANIENLYNPDLGKPLKELSQRLELARVYKLYDLLLETRQRLDSPVNKQLMFEEILIKWSEINLLSK
jgi:DNA polymerase-3 subunit delta'